MKSKIDILLERSYLKLEIKKSKIDLKVFLKSILCNEEKSKFLQRKREKKNN